jgi:hypothetical protein
MQLMQLQLQLMQLMLQIICCQSVSLPQGAAFTATELMTSPER